ncbi:MAG: hypothetical protein QY307_09560 [Acidimicrobiia bacterium]|nr:MAG: hypothetical protein QY307_09560 [Acidimicrobiia bacterium]
MSDSALVDARSAIAQCQTVVDRLHKMCCDPERSPRMAAIEQALIEVRRDLDSEDQGSLGRALRGAEEVGAAIGRLQVGCCAPLRMPLYANALTHLNTIQLGVSKELGRAH